MTKIRRSLLKDIVTVETFLGTAASGPSHSAAVSVNCSADRTRRLVIGTDGRETISELTLTVHPEDETRFTPGSRATYSGRVSTVISALPQTFRGYVTEVKVACT